jgi:hypothetical protein
VGAYTLTWSGNAADLSNAIYAAVLNGYNVTYATGNVTNGGTGDNNVFSTITRDLLVGFSYGFINSANAGNMTSQQWMRLSNADAFANAQPDNPYYNQYAAAIAGTFSDVYSFPFNDYLSGFSPEMSVNTGDTLTITLLPVPEPGTWALFALGVGASWFSVAKRPGSCASSVHSTSSGGTRSASSSRARSRHDSKTGWMTTVRMVKARPSERSRCRWGSEAVCRS